MRKITSASVAFLLTLGTLCHAQEPYLMTVERSGGRTIETFGGDVVFHTTLLSTNLDNTIASLTNTFVSVFEYPDQAFSILAAAAPVQFTNTSVAIAFMTNSANRTFVNLTNSLTLVNAAAAITYTNGIGNVASMLTNLTHVNFVNITQANAIVRSLSGVTITNLASITNLIAQGG